jgi:isoquinoline 1-oxidoreductase alpha subunit
MRGLCLNRRTILPSPETIPESPMPSLNANGKVLHYAADSGTPLLWVLREQLRLTGTKYGCGVAQSGACTVLIDGTPVRSCIRPAESVGASEKIVTMEGLSPDGRHPVQKAWAALDVPQCGFCQSGMIMADAALVASKPTPTDAEIDAAMTNICRCGTYNRVRAAIKVVAAGGDAKRAGLDIQHVSAAAAPKGAA